jgi:hypothetical protein
VTAGVGPFNGSYVPQFLEALSSFEPEYKLTTIPYSYFRAVNGLITNPLYSTIAEPISCASNGSPKCASYLLSGGLTMATPWMSDGDPDHPLARIHDVPVVQIEFSTNADFEILDNIVPEDCQIFGSNETLIAANLCISSPKEDVLEAGEQIVPMMHPSSSTVED